MQSDAVRALEPVAELDPVDRCIAYLIDVEGRAQRFSRQYPRSRVIEVRLEELNHAANVKSLFERLGLQWTEATDATMGKVVYARQAQKERVGKFVSEEYCLERTMSYLEKCKVQGIDVPPLPLSQEV